MKKNIYNQDFLYIKSQKEVESTIDKILDKGADILYDKYLVDKWPEYVAEDIMYWADGIFSQKNIITDKGESKLQLQHRWKPEEEPLTVGLDSRARFAVKVQYKQSQNDLNDLEEVKSVQSTSSIGFSFKSSKVNISGSQKNSQQQAGKKRSKFRQNTGLTVTSKFRTNTFDDSINQKGGSYNGSQNEENFEEEDIPQAVKVGEDSEPPTPDPVTEKLRENREKKEKEKKIQQKQEQKQQEEEDQFKQRQNELSKQLRNKNVTFDNNGEIILVKDKKQNYMFDRNEAPPQVDGFGLEYKNPNRKTGKIERLGYLKNVAAPEVVNYNMIQDMRKKKEKERLDKAEPPPTQEFHKQPNQVDFLNPKTGVNVIFQNGYKKEGGFIEYEKKMRRSQYDEIVENSPNRPVPQYLPQSEDGLLHPPNNQFRLRLQNQLELQKSRQRPNTAGNFYTPQGVLIGDQDLYVEMMAEEEYLKNNKKSFLGVSRISHISHKSHKSHLTQSKIQNLKMNPPQVPGMQRQRPQTSKSENRIQLFKQQKVGLKGAYQVPYDLGFEYDKLNKIDQIQEMSQENLQNTKETKLEKMRKKVDQFNKKIKEDKSWGAFQQDMQLSNFNGNSLQKKKARPTSYTSIKRTPNLLNNIVQNNNSIYPSIKTSHVRVQSGNTQKKNFFNNNQETINNTKGRKQIIDNLYETKNQFKNNTKNKTNTVSQNLIQKQNLNQNNKQITSPSNSIQKY